MSRIIFVDTMFVIALVNQRDQYHAIAKRLAIDCAGSRFVISDGVILEIGNGLARTFRAQAIETITQLLAAPDVTVVRLDSVLFDAGFALFCTHRDKEWGLVDCISFAVMRRLGIEESLTFDQHFVQAGFRALMRDLD